MRKLNPVIKRVGKLVYCIFHYVFMFLNIFSVWTFRMD